MRFMSDLGGWIDEYHLEELNQARGRADTAKLVATFTTAISASLVATELQVRSGGMSGWDLLAVIALGLAFSFTLGVAGLDRLTVVDVREILTQQTALGAPADQTLNALRAASRATLTFNDGVLAQIRVALVLQLVAATVAGVAATWVTWVGAS